MNNRIIIHLFSSVHYSYQSISSSFTGFVSKFFEFRGVPNEPIYRPIGKYFPI